MPGSSGLSDSQLQQMLKNVPGFQGVFAIDRLPGVLPAKAAGIVNFQKHNQRGSHWVAYITKPNWDVVMYFDSYGAPPPDALLDYLKQADKPVWWSDQQYQEYGSPLCGYYCADVIKHALGESGASPKSVLQRFTSHPSHSNEVKARELK